jgi:diguanylate cyclase (GGDEF)-like protein
MTLPVDYIGTLGSDDDQRKLHSRLKQAVIMMVDDEPIVMDILETFLEEKGYHQFIKVDQSELAIDTIKREEPDILLLDLKMPKVNGFDILDSIRRDNDIKFLPVIVLTSSTDPANKLKALELGATEFLAKPVDASELALRLRNSLTIKAYQDQLAYYDTLTRLPNRKLFIERVERAIHHADPAQTLAVMSIAVDRFKQINDSFGLKVGDALLQQIATRLMNVLRQLDNTHDQEKADVIRKIARSGGDEFSVLLTEAADVSRVEGITVQLQDSLREPFDVDSNEIFVTASIGVANYPTDAGETDVLLKQADAACAFAKKSGRDNYQLYSPAINAMSREVMGLETALRRALEKQQLSVYYQPKISIATGEIMGMEALLRWFQEDGKFIPPDLFIPIAEETGLIIPIGEWVLHEACRQNSEWQQQGIEGLKISVNVSGHQFRKAGFASIIEKTLASTGMDAKYLVVELTESMLTGDTDRHIRILNAIKELGAGLSIDDFGTGYSSLSYLSRFPIDELKIDRSFIIDVPKNPQDSAIVKAIIAMAQSLHLSVVAEGVEDEAQVEYLQTLDCDIIQGYYFSRPLPAADFYAFMKANGARVKMPAMLQANG